MKFIAIFSIIILSLPTQASEVVLLGQSENIAFDDVKALYIGKTVERLLNNCATKIKVQNIPKVNYKGVRVNIPNSSVIVEAHIFPNSNNTYLIKLYVKENGTNYLYGKYTDYAYQLISMLETKI